VRRWRRGIRLPRRRLYRLLAVLLPAVMMAGAIGFTRSQEADAALPSDGLDKTPSQPFVLKWTNAYLNAEVARLAYEDKITVRARELARLGLWEVGFLSKDSAQALVAMTRDGQFTFIGFRGTQEFRDWAVDANVGLATPNWDGNVTVHAGFNNSVQALYDKVLPLAKNVVTNGRTLFLSGHSLGGSMAHIAAYRLHLDGASPHSVYTFGALRAGTSTFASRYNSRLAAKTHDFVNKTDPAQCVPSNPTKGWTSLIGRHYYLNGTTATPRDDNDGCSVLNGIVESTRPAVVDKLIQGVEKVCKKITPKRIRRFLRRIFPGYCRPAPLITSMIGLGTNLLELVRAGGLGDHPIEDYIKSLKAAMPADVRSTNLVARPAQLRAVDPLSGSLSIISDDASNIFGWTSVTGWRRGTRMFQAKASEERGFFRVDELNSSGKAVMVTDGAIPLGMNVVGTFGIDPAGGPTHILFFGSGIMMTRAIGADGRLGADLSTVAMVDDVPIDTDTFGPTQAAVWDADGSGPRLPHVVAYDQETGQYRVRTLNANGTIGAEKARGRMGTGFDSITFLPTRPVTSLMFVSSETGAVTNMLIDTTENPSFLLQTVAAGQTVGGYQAVGGWTSVLWQVTEGGFWAYFHSESTGEVKRYVLTSLGTFARWQDTVTWTAPSVGGGWTALAMVPSANPTCGWCGVMTAVKA
jgi:triacylglycerol lipase